MAQTLHSLLHAVGLSVPEVCPNPAITALTCDSRCASNGSLFLGLPGERVDGGSFWRQTLADGAAASDRCGSGVGGSTIPADPVVVVADQWPIGPSPGRSVLAVPLPSHDPSGDWDKRQNHHHPSGRTPL